MINYKYQNKQREQSKILSDKKKEKLVCKMKGEVHPDDVNYTLQGLLEIIDGLAKEYVYSDCNPVDGEKLYDYGTNLRLKKGISMNIHPFFQECIIKYKTELREDKINKILN